MDFEKSGGIIVLTGLAVAALGGALGVNPLGLVGLGVMGAGIICWGLSGLIERRILFFDPGGRYSESYYGMAARAWGALLCLAGLSLLVSSAVTIFKPGAWLEQIADIGPSTSVVMVLGGLAGMLYSVTLIVGRAEDNSTRLRKLMTLPRRLLGIVLLILSLMLAAVGLTSLLFPQFYEMVTQYIADRVQRVPQLTSE